MRDRDGSCRQPTRAFAPALMPTSPPAHASPGSVPDPRPCPRCGKPVPPAADAAAPGGLCPACLLAAAFFTEPAPGAASADSAPPPDPAALAPEFPALEIIELLDRGGMGAVYKARQRDLDRLVALKILRPGLDADPTFAARFAEEARCLDLTEPTLRVVLHRLRQRYRQLLRAEIAHTVARPEDIDDELRHLIAAVSAP